jgi:hypothetical protein
MFIGASLCLQEKSWINLPITRHNSVILTFRSDVVVRYIIKACISFDNRITDAVILN